ncbi:MAG: DUF4442 domain-containing protein [Nitritalea sp.]
MAEKITPAHRELNPAALSYRKKMTSPLIFKVAMLSKLPSALFWKLKIEELDGEQCVVSIPFTWRTQNPFKSIYFAALAGAAELSTGALCQLALAGKGKFSMLVVDFRAAYYKKADARIRFTCAQGEEVAQLVDSLQIGESGTITTVSRGLNPEGQEVAKFDVTWSFKRKA